jgi:hypothetical protein
MGSAPAWYHVVTAARYFGVAPWELMQQPREWLDIALEASSAEAAAKAAAAERAQRK